VGQGRRTGPRVYGGVGDRRSQFPMDLFAVFYAMTV